MEKPFHKGKPGFCLEKIPPGRETTQVTRGLRGNQPRINSEPISGPSKFPEGRSGKKRKTKRKRKGGPCNDNVGQEIGPQDVIPESYTDVIITLESDTRHHRGVPHEHKRFRQEMSLPYLGGKETESQFGGGAHQSRRLGNEEERDLGSERNWNKKC